MNARALRWPGRPFLLLGVCLILAACFNPATAPQAAQKSAAPKTPAKVALTVAAKPANPWEDFHRNVQPFLAKHCYECHGDENAENGFRLDVISDAASLDEGGKSLEMALKNLSIHKMPPKTEPQPEEAERAKIVGWLKTYLAGDPTGPINPGRVTLRRLNRAEYNNTIRDLLAIDIRPADVFPVDDAGYGFDNNGDVLSLAPVLMEKYLTAAGLAVDKAIHCDPIVPPPLKRWDASIVDGSIPKGDPMAVAPLTPPSAPEPPPGVAPRRTMLLGRLFKFNGEIYADYELPADGDYVLRVRAYGTQGSENRQRPSVEFAVDGVPAGKPLTIKEDQRNTSVYALEKTKLTAGKHRIALALVNGSTPEEAAEYARKTPPPKIKTEAEIAAEEAAAVAAENAAEAAAAAALAAAAKPPAADGAAPAVGAGRGPADADEAGVQRQVPARIVRAGVAAARIGLPDLDHGVGDGRAVAVQHAADDLDHLAGHRAARAADVEQIVFGREQVRAGAHVRVAHQVGAAFPGQGVMEERPHCLPGGLAEDLRALIVEASAVGDHGRVSMGVASRPRRTRSNR